jgi:transcriptional regulator with XRE-family HTH domain
MKDTSAFGEQLILLARSKGFKTQGAIAKLFGKQQSTISELERGETPPTIDFIFLCAEKLQLKPSELYNLLKLGFHDMEKFSFEKQSVRGISQDAFITFLAGSLAFERPNPEAHTINCQGLFDLEKQIATVAGELWDRSARLR